MAGYDRLEDAVLVELMRRDGDHSAFAELYDRHWQAMVAHAAVMLSDPDEALDVVQEVFASIWKQRESLHLRQSLKAYLHSAVRYQTLKAIRKGRGQDAFVREFAASAERDRSEAADAPLAVQELSDLIDEAVGALSPRLREVFHKSREEGKSHREIAEELGISEHTVKSAIHRTLAVLKDKLAPFLGMLLALFQ